MPDTSATIGPDALGILDANGDLVHSVTPSSGRAATYELGTVRVSAITAAHAPWRLRIVRVEGTGVIDGVAVTGAAATTAPGDPVLPTDVPQGRDLCVAREDGDGFTEQHSELRILIPYDAVVDHTTARGGDGRTTVWPRVRVRDVPAGFPIIVALREGAEPPALPEVNERPTDENGKPLRIWRTGSSIPEVEVAPTRDGGHEIAVRWPDRIREVVVLPGLRS